MYIIKHNNKIFGEKYFKCNGSFSLKMVNKLQRKFKVEAFLNKIMFCGVTLSCVNKMIMQNFVFKTLYKFLLN